MTVAPNYHSELYELAGAQCEGTMTADQAGRLEELVLGDGRLRRMYILYMHVHACAENSGRQNTDVQRREMAGSQASGGEAGFGVRDSGFGIRNLEPFSAGEAVELPSGQWPRTPNPEPPFPVLSTTNYPLPTSHFSVDSWAFSYMVATVIMGVMLLGFWAYKITHHQHIAAAPSVPSDAMPEMVFVGRITGMVDVKWSDDPHYLPPPDFAHVPLDRKYILSSGLLEITYDSGAKVILQGPCTYEVESTAGGYLSLGKLTARVESGEWRVESEENAANQKFSPLSTLHSPLFSVRTPTATITDLGTEFGVEVSEEGASGVQVFQGLVTVAAKSGDSTEEPRKLGAGEAVRVEPDAKGYARIVDVTGTSSGVPARFVRRMPRFDPHAYAKAVLADNPVAYWRLNETSGDGTTVHDSADADGSPQQGAQNGVFKKTDSFAGLGYPGPRPSTYRGLEYNNKAPRFWGDYYPSKKLAYVDAGNPPALQITGQLTLEAWVYIEEYGGDYHSGVISKYCGRRQPHGAMDQRSYNLLITRDGKPAFYISADGTRADELYVSSDGTRANVAHVVSATTAPLNAWLHLAAVYVPGGSMKIYRNGALDAELTTSVPTSIFNSTADTWIGIQHAAEWRFNFKGRIDEAAVYDTALSGARIAAHYAAAVEMAATETENRKED